MYQALYRKWRPKIFEDVLGQSHITDTLKNQIVNNKLSHAYLFSGTRGTGKTSTAKILARAVNCENPVNGNPCNECYACKSALEGSAVDIIEMDAASNNKVEDARIIRDEVIYTPAEFRYKVYIIDEAHMLTQNAFNALLKTLEEPPSHIIFIFATTEPQKFPATILSRCQRFDFKRIIPFHIGNRIKQILRSEECSITDEAVGLVVRVADGSMRDALSLLDQCVSLGGKNIDTDIVSQIAGVSDPKFIADFAETIVNGDISSAMKCVKSAYDKGFELSSACDELLEFFRNVMIAKTVEDRKSIAEILEISENETDIYRKVADDVSVERILRYIDMLEKAINKRAFVDNPRLSLEIALTGMMKRPDITEPQGMLEKLMELENRIRKIESGGIRFKEISEPYISEVKEEIPQISELITEEVFEPVCDVEEPNISQQEKSDYPIYENNFVPKEDSGNSEIKTLWSDVLISASKNSLPGFDRIMSGTTTDFSENTVEIYFENDSFLKIAQMNKFDENIVRAYKQIGSIDVTVKMKLGEKENKENDNYSDLLSKLRNTDNVEYL